MRRSTPSAYSASVAIPMASTTSAASSRQQPSRTGPASSPSRSAAAPPINSRPKALFAVIAGSSGRERGEQPGPRDGVEQPESSEHRACQA